MSEFRQSAEAFCDKWAALKPDVDIVECAMLAGAELALKKLEQTQPKTVTKPQ